MNKPPAELVDAGGACLDLASWVCAIAGRAGGRAAVLSPEFCLYDGGVFFAGFDVEIYQAWLRALKGNKTAVQAVLNHRHILEFFLAAEREPARSQIICFGRKLEKRWSAKLRLDFPTENIVVSFREDKAHDGDALLAHLITFFIPREADARDRPRLFLGACHPRAHL